MKNPKPAIGVINLGCAKNLVDAEKLITQLIINGYEIVTTYEEADLIIINTCGFINEAIQESLDTIADALQHHDKVIVTGCLGVNKQIIKQHHPQTLYICGPNKITEVIAAVQKYLPIRTLSTYEIPATGFKLTPSHYAYLKISEGCNHQCSFCIIPQLRGKLISRSFKTIMHEAEQLVDAGVKELIIISQDTTAYEYDLVELTHALGELGIWIRLHYLYPHKIIEDILPLMNQNKILPYLDVPLQHCNARILKLMQRPGNQHNLLKQIALWRDICPNLTIRSTFIVGFPGETAQEFNELLNFLEEAQLDRVGCFRYSPVKGAAANQLSNHVPEKIKQQRQAELMKLQAKISAQKLQTKIDTTIQVLIDEVNHDKAIGRTPGDSPEIDGNVYLAGLTQKDKMRGKKIAGKQFFVARSAPRKGWKPWMASSKNERKTRVYKITNERFKRAFNKADRFSRKSSFNNAHQLNSGDLVDVLIKDSDEHDLFGELS